MQRQSRIEQGYPDRGWARHKGQIEVALDTDNQIVVSLDTNNQT